VRKFIEGATVVSAGAKMIPEGGWLAVPRDQASGVIGKANTLILGDSAGFVNMLKIKGLHNAIESGLSAAQAICSNISTPENAAKAYTEKVDGGSIGKEMKTAQNFRQMVGKLGPTLGFPLSIFAGILPKFKVHKDFEAMTCRRYKLKCNKEFDKDTFTALAQTHHREEQPCHLSIVDPSICREKCEPAFDRPCVTFCPAGVYATSLQRAKRKRSSTI
jgi:electron-transferring-flavoprotein dehydrogenase